MQLTMYEIFCFKIEVKNEANSYHAKQWPTPPSAVFLLRILSIPLSLLSLDATLTMYHLLTIQFFWVNFA